MISVTVSVDTSRFDRMMSDFPAALARARSRALSWIGQHVATDATLAFRTPSLRPSPWAPRKDKKSKHPLLIRSGSLRQSIRWRITAADTVEVGSDKKYASFHQDGTRNMPARIMRKIDADIEKAYSAELRRVAAGG